MNLDKLKKIAYVLGISMSVVMFSLIVYGITPDLMREGRWDRVDVDVIYPPSDAIYELLKNDPAYLAMFEKYPDAKEKFDPRGQGRGQLDVAMGNFDDEGKILTLELEYDRGDKIIHTRINCKDFTNEHNGNVNFRGPLVIQYIQENNCLNEGIMVDNRVPEPIYGKPFPSTCGPDTRLVDGICLVLD